MRICIIGDSHAGALKRAWTMLEEWHGHLELVFFAAPGGMLQSVAASETCLYTRNKALKSAFMYTSGGLEHIHPADYDAVLIYGTQCQPYFKPSGIYSNAVLQQSLEDHGKYSLSFSILKMVAGLTSGAIFVGHDPLLSSGGNLAEDNDYEVCTNAYVDGCQLINLRLYQPIGTELVMQPLGTIVNGKHTHIDFGRGSQRLPVGDGINDGFHPPHDRTHMNDKFGKQWLEYFFSEHLGLLCNNNKNVSLVG